MLNLCSSQNASTTSCSLRDTVRSCVRNRFLASCWVMVEPPCEAPRRSTSAMPARMMPQRIDAVMGIEAAILDGDERLGHVVRQFAQRHRRAAHVAARRERRAVRAEDQDRGRALGNFERLDGRQMDADPNERADRGDDRPQRQHRAPIDQTADAGTAFAAAAPRRRLRVSRRGARRHAGGGPRRRAPAGGPPVRSCGRSRRSRAPASCARLRPTCRRHAISRPRRAHALWRR